MAARRTAADSRSAGQCSSSSSAHVMEGGGGGVVEGKATES